MRDRDRWHAKLSKQLTQRWGDVPEELSGTRPALVCQVELALRLLEHIAPDESPRGAYVLFGGYPFTRARGLSVTEEHDIMLTAGRHLLWTLRRRRTWHQALDTYRALPPRLRAYEMPEGGAAAVRTEPADSERFTLYDMALAALPPLARKELPLAPPGRSTFLAWRRPTSVTLPAGLAAAAVPAHRPDLGRPGAGAPLVLKRSELSLTAQWMDETERAVDVANLGHWQDRLRELRFAPRSSDGLSFVDADTLRIDGLLHLAGMVGAGKSTLMTLVAVWGARQGLRTTLVVGDVAEQLRLTALLRDLGLSAAPVLGLTTRQTHVQRLHRRLAARGLENLLDHDAPAFDDLSTVCVVNALRGTEAPEPLRYSDAPCTSLYPEKRPSEQPAEAVDQAPALPEPYRPGRSTPRLTETRPTELRGAPHGCPLWHVCPRHHTARELVDALIWVANPASLVQSAVPRHLGDERLRHLELALIRSDMVFVDEADSVQMKLDEIFAPSATLVSPGIDSWLDQVQTHRIEELSKQGRLPLTDQEIERWSASLTVAHSATDRLYKLLISDAELREWADIEYFSPWTLQEKLLGEWFAPAAPYGGPDGVPDETELYEAYEDDSPEPESAGPVADAVRQELTALFDTFRDDPLGGDGPYANETDDLVRLAHDVLTTLSTPSTRERVITVLRPLLARTPAKVRTDDVQWLDLTVRRLEFMLLVSALNQRLDRLVFLWPQVEAALHLDSTGNELSRRPPLDYAPLVPEAPMGNVLGFQYLPDERERDDDGRHSGTLRFFRCAGVGRSLLLSLHEVGADPGAGQKGPHVVLMSGTSWAGTSTRAHVLAPVGAVLKPSERSLQAVGESVFTTHFLFDDKGRPMSLSGVDPKTRPAAARALAAKLGSPGRGGAPSPLEQELAEVADDRRRRAILLVGSYKEANTVAEVLNGQDRWRGRVRVLAADDADLEQAVGTSGPARASGQGAVTVLRRGDLASFAEDRSAEVLVAPLMAVERGHNILNAQHNAAFGTALFLARPHPRPDDLSLAIFAINDWASRFVRDEPGLEQGTFGKLAVDAPDLDTAGLAFRHVARGEWRRLLARRYIYSRLSDREKRSFTWDQLVTIWQVIGRLVRGGVPARVVFVDARFAPRTARALSPRSLSSPVPSQDGLLTGLRDVLAPYFDTSIPPTDFPDSGDPAVARLLYAPLYKALRDITHHIS
ncbi:hypothetical protein OHT52_05070 [Streptomyces sp. NBC_00247]|uniref:pPIWI_RE_Z domain-containing protein n=1 Tax=Streptomyces sp. NBC_00247 TaxID=2975689 RepID=UPI002E2DD302|nr:hypothetical protein [Streptomyces sp. NBC_00247]